MFTKLLLAVSNDICCECTGLMQRQVTEVECLSLCRAQPVRDLQGQY